MFTLVLVRHGESEWNKANLFTGWTDVELSSEGWKEAENAGCLLDSKNFAFTFCYTSFLKRAINTAEIILDKMDLDWIPVIKAWQLNERHYGALQGLNKQETGEKYGTEQVKIWRRSYDIRPPLLPHDDPRNPAFDPKYKDVNPRDLPLGESLEDTAKRVIPYFENIIKKDILRKEKVLISAHGNSLRALVMYFEHLSPQEIIEVNIPTGVPLIYEFDDNMQVIKKYYLEN